MMFWTLFALGYALMGVGTARAILTRRVKANIEEFGIPNYGDFDVSGYATFGGIFWPLTLVGWAAWAGVIRSIGTVVSPFVVRWFMAPSRKIEAEHKARREAELKARIEAERLINEAREAKRRAERAKVAYTVGERRS